MDSNIEYIDKLEELKSFINSLLISENDYRVWVAGTFDNEVYKDIIEMVLNKGCTKNLQIIIPMVGKNGLVSRSYINKICSAGGEIKINSKFKNNIVIIGRHIFVISFSNNYSANNGMKITFECCVATNEVSTVAKISNRFIDIWNHSLPLVQN